MIIPLCASAVEKVKSPFLHGETKKWLAWPESPSRQFLSICTDCTQNVPHTLHNVCRDAANRQEITQIPVRACPPVRLYSIGRATVPGPLIDIYLGKGGSYSTGTGSWPPRPEPHNKPLDQSAGCNTSLNFGSKGWEFCSSLFPVP